MSVPTTMKKVWEHFFGVKLRETTEKRLTYKGEGTMPPVSWRKLEPDVKKQQQRE